MKSILKLSEDQLREHGKKQPEAGVGFMIANTGKGPLAILSNGYCLPMYDSDYYNVNDLVNGELIPEETVYDEVKIDNFFEDRSSALDSLLAARISPKYHGNTGAFPLIASLRLGKDTIFHRYLSRPVDHRFIGGQLTPGTYISPLLDAVYLNSGFAVVGRLALPIPLPAVHVIHYKVDAGTIIHFGTVAPAFGQAGGGVEVCLKKGGKAVRVGTATLPDH